MTTGTQTPAISSDTVDPLLKVTNLSKNFGSVQALSSMNFELRAGEVHVLFGENGAGKSTLIHIIAGAIAPSSGTVVLDGAPVAFHSVLEARRHGVAAMFQEFSAAPDLSVEENIMLGAEPRRGIFLKVGERRKLVRESLMRFGFDLNPRTPVCHLSRAQQQMVEMIKALVTNPRILILDEPTASLSSRETEAMFELVRSLKARGVGIIYITHRIKEISEIGDRVTIMRDGKFIATVDAKTTDDQRLVELMIGREIGNFYPKIPHSPGPEMLSVESLSTIDGKIRDISLNVHAGEIVGIAGLVGCGKSEIGRAIFGLLKLKAGAIMVEGKNHPAPTPESMLKRGVSYITSDRRNEGLMLLRSAQENLTLPSIAASPLSSYGWLRRSAEADFAKTLGEKMLMRPFDLSRIVAKYSGGNQQKILIGRTLGCGTRIFIFDEPTVGIDVAARVEVYAFLKQLVSQGAAIIIVSSDLPEIISMSHRLYVVSDGEIVDYMTGEEICETRVLHGFFGHGQKGAEPEIRRRQA